MITNEVKIHQIYSNPISEGRLQIFCPFPENKDMWVLLALFRLSSSKYYRNWFRVNLNMIFQATWGSLNTSTCRSKHYVIKHNTAHKSEPNEKCGKQANLLMTLDVENRHSTAITNLPRLLKSLNANYKNHFCMNCFSGFTQL